MFNGIGGTLDGVDLGDRLNVNSALLATDNGVVLTYTPTPSSATLFYEGRGTTYEPLEGELGGYKFSKSGSLTEPFVSFAFGPLPPTLDYVATAFERVRDPSHERERRILFGAVTSIGDLPVGSRTFTTDVALSGRVAYANYNYTDRAASFTSLSASQARFFVDVTNGSVQATISTKQTSYQTGTTPAEPTLVFSGTITARNFIEGTITSPDSGYTGRFVGHLYGPQGAEVGLMIELGRADGTRQIGVLFGRR